MKRTFIFSCICLVSTLAVSQTIAFEKKIGRSGTSDWGKAMSRTSDNGYIISGLTGGIGFGQEDIYLVKTNAAGDTLWTRVFGTPSAGEYAESVIQTTDGGYALLGYTESYGAGAADFYCIKTDANGDTLWTKTYGNQVNNMGYCIRQTTDGGYVMAGSTYDYIDGGYDVYLIKTTSTGDTLWTKTYGDAYDDDALAVIQTADGGYMISGYTSNFGADYLDGLLIKTDANGIQQWIKTYDGPQTGSNSGDYINAVQATSDGGYVLTGTRGYIGSSSYTGQVWLVKTNAVGDTLWTRSYGQINADDANGEEVKICADGGFIVTGSRNTNGVGLDAFLIRTNSNGDTLWTKTIDSGSTGDKGLSMTISNDNAFVVTGYTTTPNEGYQVYLLKVTDPASSLAIPENSNSGNVSVYPNPAADFVQVTITGSDKQKYTAELYDVSGRRVKHYIDQEAEFKMSVEDLNPGTYVLELKNKNEIFYTGKVIVAAE